MMLNREILQFATLYIQISPDPNYLKEITKALHKLRENGTLLQGVILDSIRYAIFQLPLQHRSDIPWNAQERERYSSELFKHIIKKLTPFEIGKLLIHNKPMMLGAAKQFPSLFRIILDACEKACDSDPSLRTRVLQKLNGPHVRKLAIKLFLLSRYYAFLDQLSNNLKKPKSTLSIMAPEFIPGPCANALEEKEEEKEDKPLEVSEEKIEPPKQVSIGQLHTLWASRSILIPNNRPNSTTISETSLFSQCPF